MPGKPIEYVLKLKVLPEISPGSSLNELLASYIALELDFSVPEPDYYPYISRLCRDDET